MAFIDHHCGIEARRSDARSDPRSPPPAVGGHAPRRGSRAGQPGRGMSRTPTPRNQGRRPRVRVIGLPSVKSARCWLVSAAGTDHRSLTQTHNAQPYRGVLRVGAWCSNWGTPTGRTNLLHRSGLGLPVFLWLTFYSAWPRTTRSVVRPGECERFNSAQERDARQSCGRPPGRLESWGRPLPRTWVRSTSLLIMIARTAVGGTTIRPV